MLVHGPVLPDTGPESSCSPRSVILGKPGHLDCAPSQARRPGHTIEYLDVCITCVSRRSADQHHRTGRAATSRPDQSEAKPKMTITIRWWQQRRHQAATTTTPMPALTAVTLTNTTMTTRAFADAVTLFPLQAQSSWKSRSSEKPVTAIRCGAPPSKGVHSRGATRQPMSSARV